ncbi:MAG TPA: YceI family protein [Verrucomicrobiae bacterium]|nr:YceI family protein [Verrucomicrobiae bacterium]
MSRRFLIPIVALAALVVLGSAGAYVYFFSGLRTSPPTLALASPSPTASATAAAPSNLGTWEITSGSLVGYRVKEQFAGQTSTHEAVARTGDVAGQVTITQNGSSYEMTSAKVTVQLANLASVDSVAGYNVRNRDGIVQRSLSVSSFPTATFEAANVALPAGVESGQQVDVTVPGQLTVHGVTKSVTATLQLRVTGNTAQIAGSIAAKMTDFGVNPPQVPFTVVQPDVTIEVSLKLTPGE